MFDNNQNFNPNSNMQGYPKPYINANQQTNFPYPMPNQNNQYPPPNPTTLPNKVIELEESFIDNLIKLNKGKTCTLYCTFHNSQEWRDRIHKGIIQNCGKDHIIINDTSTNHRLVIPLLYVDWIESQDELNSEYPIRVQQL